MAVEQQPAPTGVQQPTLSEQARQLAEQDGHVPGTFSHDMATDEHYARLRRDEIEAHPPTWFQNL